MSPLERLAYFSSAVFLTVGLCDRPSQPSVLNIDLRSSRVSTPHLFINPFSESSPEPPVLCYRNDNPDLMSEVLASGATMVRIWGPYEDIGNPSSRTEQALVRADLLHLNTLFVLAPTTLLSEPVLRSTVRQLIFRHPRIMIELGNEPDIHVDGYQPWIPFEQDGFASFTRFVTIALDEAVKTNPQITIGLAALGDVKNTKAFLDSIALARVPISRFNFFSLHSYNLPDDLYSRLSVVMPLLRDYVIAPQIWLTELGIDNPGQHDHLPEFWSYANSLVGLSCLHEFGGTTSYGISSATRRQISQLKTN